MQTVGIHVPGGVPADKGRAGGDPLDASLDSRSLFEILVREHAGMLTLYVRSIARDGALADELFQETIVTAWRSIERFDRERSFGKWLRGIARNLLLARRRRDARDARRLPVLPDEVLEALDERCESLARHPGDDLDEKLASLRACLGVLPERFRRALHLRYHDELHGDALARALEVTLENAKKQIQRGRQMLADCLRRRLVAEGAS